LIRKSRAPAAIAAYGVGNLGAAAHHDHRGGRPLAPGGLQDVEAVDLGHAQIGQDEVEVLALQAGQTAGTVGGHHFEGGGPQQTRQPTAERLLVVTQE
jgi:hypothetical protein